MIVPPRFFRTLGALLIFIASLNAGCTFYGFQPGHVGLRHDGRPLQPPAEPFVWPPFDLDAAETELAQFTEKVNSLSSKRKFKELEALAHELSSSKARFVGGGWRIHSFYQVATVRQGNTENDWLEEIAFLKAWRKAFPSSPTAASLLANAYINFAWKARGGGYANEVDEDSWHVFQSRLELADAQIKEVSKLAEKCYLYYEVRIALSRALNHTHETSEHSFLQAIRFDPDYQYFYGYHAVSLMPRWGGVPGAWERFAEDTKKRIGGRRGLQIYYLIVADVMDLGYQDFFSENRPLWKDAKEGYRLLVEDFGTSRLHLNIFARMAEAAQDLPTFCAAFERINGQNNFVPNVWRKFRGQYEVVRLSADSACKTGHSYGMAP